MSIPFVQEATSLEQEFESIFREVDFLLLPGIPGTAPTISEAENWQPEDILALDTLHLPASLAGLTQDNNFTS